MLSGTWLLRVTGIGAFVNNTILITGGAGAIGSNLANRLSQDPRSKIVVLDNLSSGHVENIRLRPNVIFIQGSVVSDEDLKRAFSYGIDIVFHLAANFANQNSVDFPERDLQTNGAGTLKLLLRTREHKVKRFVYSSSSCVYGNRDAPLNETCREFSSDTPYAITKLLGEQYVRFFAEHDSLKATILRYFNVYGPNEYPGKYRNVIANFFYCAMNRKDIVITGSGDETRDFNFVDDTVEATILASENKEAVGLDFNIASGRETKIEEVAKMVLKIVESKSKIVYRPRRAWDSVLRRVGSIDRAKKILHYEPKYLLAKGLARYYRWLKQQDLNKCEW